MKEKIISTVLVIMAVAMYTTAVINFMQVVIVTGIVACLPWRTQEAHHLRRCASLSFENWQKKERIKKE